MADLPYMKFYPADWLADCGELSVGARGAWHSFLCKAWLMRSASVTLKAAQWSRMFGAANAEHAERLIAEIEECGIGGVTRADDGRVTLTSRRIARDLHAMTATRETRSEAARIAATARWEKERMRDACQTHAKRNADAMRKHAIPEARSQKPEDYHTTTRACEVPTVGAVREYAASAPVPISPECATAFFDSAQAEGWVGKSGRPIVDWRAAMRRYASRWNEIEKAKPPTRAHREDKAAREYPEPQHKSIPLPRA